MKKSRKKTSLAERELVVVKKIAKLSGNEVGVDEKNNEVIVITPVSSIRSCEYMRLDLKRPFSGLMFTNKSGFGVCGLRLRAAGKMGWKPNDYGFNLPEWVGRASLEEAELRLEILGVFI